MSRKATTHDNIMIEIFFGRMKVEMFYGKEKTFKDLNDLEKAIKDYINWYNSDRVCKKLKGLSPINSDFVEKYAIRKCKKLKNRSKQQGKGDLRLSLSFCL